MFVYVVARIEDDWSNVVKVFRTKAQAVAFCKTRRISPYVGYRIYKRKLTN